jgi:D-glycero-D-manno-heptose 1,7-bisphosphate phosphatase
VRAGWRATGQCGPLAFGPNGPPRVPPGSPLAFLDRDGVINEATPDPTTNLPESPLRVEDVRLLEGTAAALSKLAAAGYALVCVSNQPAAAKGKLTIDELCEVHERVLELIAREGVALDASRLCPHHPEGVVESLSGPCGCRKPAPGMLLDAARELEGNLSASWMLGDTDSDVQAGKAARCRSLLIEYPGSVHKRLGRASPDLRASGLADGVARLLERSG